MAIHKSHELLSAVRLLLSEDRNEGRFVFGRQVHTSLKPSVGAAHPGLVSQNANGPGGDNAKSQLQTLLTRAGYTPPIYKTKQLKNAKFQSSVEFNGMEVMGQHCNNKKTAEKDAAAEAIKWLVSGTQMGQEQINHMSMMLKKSRKG